MPNNIKHLWFDFSATLAFIDAARRDQLRYSTYAELIGRPISPTLIAEYNDLYEKFDHNNTAIFHSLGQSANFWSERIDLSGTAGLYQLARKNIPDVLEKIRAVVPVSIFSNIDLGSILIELGLRPEWFTHILSSGMVKEPKPALDGFYKIIELSRLPAANIIYIGDHLGKDIRPAKKVGLRAGLMWAKSPEADYSFEKFEDILEIFE